MTPPPNDRYRPNRSSNDDRYPRDVWKPSQPSQRNQPPQPRQQSGPVPQGQHHPPAQSPSHWGDVASWYDALVGEEGSDYQRNVVFPGLLDMLAPKPRQRILDIACGQGVFCRILHHHGCEATGIDAAPQLIQIAKDRSNPTIDYQLGDAQQLQNLGLEEASFDAATCVLAIQNIENIEKVCQGAADLLKPQGRFYIIMMHPAFRGPKASGWQWDEETTSQRRWVTHYLGHRKEPIITHPGKDPTGHTWTYHRPIEDYIHALSRAGLLVSDLQEWSSHKVSDSGPRAKAENVSREEIPMFMAIEAVKR